MYEAIYYLEYEFRDFMGYSSILFGVAKSSHRTKNMKDIISCHVKRKDHVPKEGLLIILHLAILYNDLDNIQEILSTSSLLSSTYILPRNINWSKRKEILQLFNEKGLKYVDPLHKDSKLE